jgi:hypothetical protein
LGLDMRFCLGNLRKIVLGWECPIFAGGRN